MVLRIMITAASKEVNKQGYDYSTVRSLMLIVKSIPKIWTGFAVLGLIYTYPKNLFESVRMYQINFYEFEIIKASCKLPRNCNLRHSWFHT